MSGRDSIGLVLVWLVGDGSVVLMIWLWCGYGLVVVWLWLDYGLVFGYGLDVV